MIRLAEILNVLEFGVVVVPEEIGEVVDEIILPTVTLIILPFIQDLINAHS